MPTIITRGAISAKAYGFGLSGGYSVSKSLRFRSSASAFFSRTESAAAASNQKLTFSAWVKRGSLTGNLGSIYQAGADASCDIIRFTNTDTLQVWFDAANSVTLVTSAVFRDPSAWYHIVVAIDTTQATSTNRIIIYVNGVIQTLTGTQPSLNATFAQFNQNTIINRFGYYNSTYFDGYIAEAYMIDGQALTPTSFGAYDTNGVWQPIKYSGTYGTNGFYLTFGNTTSTTTLGYDTSGNSNNWTTNNVSLTAGTTYDSMTDSPTVSSATVANYATLNAVIPTNSTLSNGNLAFSQTTSQRNGSTQTVIPTSGKWYFEAQYATGNSCAIGIQPTSQIGTNTFYSTNAVGIVAVELQAGQIYSNASLVQTVSPVFTAGDVIGVAYDMGGNTVQFYRNGSTYGSSVALTSSIIYAAYISNGSGAQTATGSINFGQQGFKYTPPTGFNALNTYNLPAPSITNGAQYMAATTYTGTGATQTISDGGNNTIGTTFQPDFVWLKSRSAATNNNLFDVLRGTTAYLISNSTATEATNANTLTAFGSTGFTVGSDASAIGVNVNAATYVGWQWKANGAGVNNTSGSITSTVSANTTAGFSIVTYTGTGANATIGHGLGVAPNMIITKSRNLGGSHWTVYHSSVGNTGALLLDTTAATNTSVNYWNNTSPTSSVFSVGIDGSVNNSGNTFVAYCWSAVSGYSAFGSYTGNGSSDGPFIYTGFRPRWIIFKNTSLNSHWAIWDSSINSYNVASANLIPDAASAENSGNGSYDFLSNGIKVRSSVANETNVSGSTYIYAAFAENPFNSSRAR